MVASSIGGRGGSSRGTSRKKAGRVSVGTAIFILSTSLSLIDQIASNLLFYPQDGNPIIVQLYVLYGRLGNFLILPFEIMFWCFVFGGLAIVYRLLRPAKSH